ncbi:unnamed protein product [Rotaria sp. Silwood1]|nr:unnamed protein product [Rotaria sp. Silwood1]
MMGILLRMSHDPKGQAEMWTSCHKIYKKNSAQLEHIDKLRKTYKACEAIKHYTENSFLSRTVNKVCRTEDFQHIFKFRVYITDLHRQLDVFGRQQEQNGIKSEITKVYCGKPLSDSVLQQLIDNKGGLISMNGFLSTTFDSDVVGVYAGDEQIAEGYRRAKFQLQISKKIRQPYAYVGNCSAKKNELEVLFSIGTIWRIESVKYDEDPCTIELTSCDELDSQLMELLEKYTGDECTLLSLGDILWELGEDLEAECFYQKMLEESTLSNQLRGALHYRIGMIRFNRKDYSIALDNLKKFESFFESSNNELNKVGSPHPLYMSGNRSLFVTIYNNMSIVLENDGKITIKCPLCQSESSRTEIIRAKIEDHYLTEQHQHAIMKVVRQMLLQLSHRQIDNDLSRITTAETSNPGTAQLQGLYEMLNILSGGIETLNNDQQRLSNESLRIQVAIPTLTQELPKLKLSIEESNAFLEGVKHNQDILNQDLASVHEKIIDLLYVSYDGILVWKITNFQEKIIDAQSERQTSIYSPPFYSSPIGYKMRARLYLNGDGNARRTHMSLFFVLMRSVNDPILKFPFNYKVTFCLYDQTPAQRHIIDSFRPDIRSSSFQRPRSDMNIASGIPKFFPLEMIHQEGNPYVRDDTMFIKVMLDFGDMPKTLLPYALSLNPGLPTHVQQAMIKQEAERRSQQQSGEQPQITSK